jgi:hypothetical protein
VPVHFDPVGDDDEHALDLHGMDDDAMGPSPEMHDDSDASQDAHDNAQIVAGLQTMYPEFYDKIAKMVLGDDGSDQDADLDDRMGGF